MAMSTPCISMNESSNNKSIKSATEVLFIFFSTSNMFVFFFLVKLGTRTAGFLIDVLYYFDNSPTAMYTNITL